MPAYFFDKLVGLVGDEFDIEFKSMKEMYEKDQGDPVERLREMAQEERDANPTTILSGAGRTRRLMILLCSFAGILIQSKIVQYIIFLETD